MSSLKKLNAFIGSILIITGTCIGAGMLAIPLITAACGFSIAIVLLILVWLLMSATAFLILEVNLNYKTGTNMQSMAKHTLGKTGRLINWVSYLLLLYALTAAYISGGSDILDHSLEHVGIYIPTFLSSLLFLLVLGGFVYAGTAAVDNLNKFLISIKFLAFFGLCGFIFFAIKTKNLLIDSPDLNYIWISFPILITAFGFHTVIPSIRSYLEPKSSKNKEVSKSFKKQLYIVIAIGAFIPLLIYVLWEIIALGVIPLFGQYSFASIAHSGNNVNGLIKMFHDQLHAPMVTTMTSIFTSVAVTTSFLGVTLGLYHFNQDTYKLKTKVHHHRILAFVITFLPPWLFAIFYPNGFLMALGFAGIFVAILLISLPAVMVWKIRSEKGKNNKLSKFYLSIIFLIGIGIIGLQVATSLHLLPRF